MAEILEPFLELTAQGKAMLAQGVHVKRFASPVQVIHKGQKVSGAYIVTHGQLRVFTYTPQGSEATLYFVRAGETCVLALNCLFNDLLYPAWVEADADTRVALIPGALYRRLFESETAVQDLTVKTLSTLVFRLMDELEQIHGCHLDQRLARFLLHHADSDGKVHMTQQQLAAHLGTTREVIARLMRGFSAEGCVQTARGEIAILDAMRLASWGKTTA